MAGDKPVAEVMETVHTKKDIEANQVRPKVHKG
jgi:hypothetical protein